MTNPKQANDTIETIAQLKEELEKFTKKYKEIKEFKYGCQHLIDDLADQAATIVQLQAETTKLREDIAEYLALPKMHCTMCFQ